MLKWETKCEHFQWEFRSSNVSFHTWRAHLIEIWSRPNSYLFSILKKSFVCVYVLGWHVNSVPSRENPGLRGKQMKKTLFFRTLLRNHDFVLEDPKKYQIMLKKIEKAKLLNKAGPEEFPFSSSLSSGLFGFKFSGYVYVAPEKVLG